MEIMFKSYKVEIRPSKQQICIFEFDFYVCRVVHNLYMRNALNQYDKNGSILSVNYFLDWFYGSFLNRPDVLERIPRHFNTIAVRRICINAHHALIKYKQNKAGRPSPKKKDSPISIYIPNKKCRYHEPICKTDKIFLPSYGWIKLREKEYIPACDATHRLMNFYISKRNNKYFISATFEEPDTVYKSNNSGEPIGIDLGVMNFAILSNGRVFPNINHTRRVIVLEQRLKRQHRALERKNKIGANITSNFLNNKRQLEQTYNRLRNIRADYIYQVVAEIIKMDPTYIAIEDLDVSEMISERRFARNISKQMFYEFRKVLTRKCKVNGIELRLVYRYFPSTKLCHNCGRIKKSMDQCERTFICECGYTADRDYNASLNIRDATDYTVIC